MQLLAVAFCLDSIWMMCSCHLFGSSIYRSAKETFAQVRADPTDPYALASTYKDDLGFLAAQDRSSSREGD